MELTFNLSEYTIHIPDAVSAWAHAFGSKMMDTGELLHLAGTLAVYPWDSEAIVVEIGAYLGHTTVFMAKVLQLLGKRVQILSIDPFERAQIDPLNPQGVYSAYIENIRANNVEDVCFPLVAFSKDAAPIVPDRIGVLVVDGSHHYPDVRKDLELYGPKVLPNGLIFIDDYGSLYPDVMRAVDEYFIHGSLFTVLHKTHFVVAQRHANATSSHLTGTSLKGGQPRPTVPSTDGNDTNEPWMIILRESQNEVAALDPHPYYLTAYRQEEFHYWQHIPRWLYEDILEHQPSKCLDIGCAYGTLLVYIKKLSNCEAYGTDFVDTYISSTLVAKYNLHFAVNNIELDPFPWDCHYDIIVFTAVMEHLNFYAVPTLKKMRNLLSEDGKLYLSTPDASQWGKTMKYYSNYKEMPMPSPELRTQVVDDHVWHFSQEELFDVIYAAGLRLLRFDFTTSRPYRLFNLTLKRME